jgi:hypothetical protein
MKPELNERIAMVEDRIRRACESCGRSRDDVNVVAVTKYVSLDATRRVIEAGFRHIGENRWQDAADKWAALGDRATWHFIGHLQSNKVKDVLGKFSYIHSLDRLSLAKELEKRAAASGIRVPCFLQLNISGERSKHGLAPEQCLAFAREIAAYEHLDVVGLMTMAPHEPEPERTRPVFRGLREWRDRLNDAGIFKHPVHELSMGMSNDFEIAIQEGATWIRLGSVLVGTE